MGKEGLSYFLYIESDNKRCMRGSEENEEGEEEENITK